MDANEQYLTDSSMPAHAFVPERRTDPAEWPDTWIDPPGKTYPSGRRVALSGEPVAEIGLRSALRARHSERKRQQPDLPFDALASMLLATLEGGHASLRRSYPSGGALYPVEMYLIAGRVAGLAAGVYHLEAAARELRLLRHLPDRRTMDRVFGFDWISGARAQVVLTGVTEKSARKYGARATRFQLIETGAVLQTLSLLAAEAKIAATVVGGFHDAGLIRLLGLEDADEWPLAALVLP